MNKNDKTTVINCYQYVNGLKVFTEPLIFDFSISGDFYSITGDTITSIDLRTECKTDEKNIQDIFLAKTEQDYQADWSKSNCYILEFGYYDLNAGSSIPEHDFIPAWEITLKGSTDVIAIIDDNTNDVIYYDNGIRNQANQTNTNYYK